MKAVASRNLQIIIFSVIGVVGGGNGYRYVRNSHYAPVHVIT